MILEATKDFFEQLGYKVISATNGKEAISQYEIYKGHIVLAVFDITMPYVTGPEAALYIQTINPTLPLIFITGASCKTHRSC